MNEQCLLLVWCTITLNKLLTERRIEEVEAIEVNSRRDGRSGPVAIARKALRVSQVKTRCEQNARASASRGRRTTESDACE